MAQNEDSDLEKWIKNTNLTQNQLAAASGLSASYIHALRSGISRADRKKLIALGCALRLDTQNINQILSYFRLEALDERDIPTFIEVAKRRRLSQKLQPLYGNILHLLLVSTESLPGKLVTLSHEPSYILKSAEHVEYDKKNQGLDELSVKIIKALQTERKGALIRGLETHDAEFYMFVDDLVSYTTQYDAYRDACDEAGHVNYVLEHILNTFEQIRKYPNYNFYVVRCLHPFRFELKFASNDLKEDKKEKNKLFFMGRDQEVKPGLDKEGEDQSLEEDIEFLTGYATDDEYLFAQFNAQYEAMKKFIVYRSDRPDKLIEFKKEIISLFKEHTKIADDPGNLKLLESLVE